MTASPDTRTREVRFWERRRIPRDTLVVVGFALLADAVALTGTMTGPAVHVAFGLPLLFFLPGYAILALLFPKRHDEASDARLRTRTTGWPGVDRPTISIGERVVLAIGVSLVVLPVIGLVLSALGLGLSTPTMVGSLTALTLVCMLLGTVRRWRLPTHEQFVLPVEEWVARTRESLAARSRVELATSALLAVALLTAVTTVGVAMVAQNNAETYTQLTLLTANGSGEYVTGDYPRDLTPGETQQFVIAVDNEERREMNYTVVGTLQQVNRSGTSTTVTDEQRLVTLQRVVPANTTWQASHTVRPELNGTEMRLNYYLYRDGPPDDPSQSNAYEHVHVWVNVTAEA
jgi:uncharacterized membrane protein